MQEREKEQETQVSPAPVDPKSEPLVPVAASPVVTQDDDPDEIFLNAVAEIDTQPLVKNRSSVTIIDVLQVLFCSCLILGSLAGIIWQAITYPKTLVILYTVEKPASLTTILDVPTRTLASVTLSRSLINPTTGHGHQDARTATGTLTFYNGQNTPQSIPVGTVLTGQDGVKITTDQPALVPAANLPNVGVVTILASAIQAGSKGNVAPYDINFALTSVLTVKNQTSFTNGRDARDFQAVAQHDLDTLTAQLLQQLSQTMPQAFSIDPGEQAQPTNCHTTTTTNHKVGDEAQTVTMNGSETCTTVGYRQSQVQAVATQIFTAQTKPGTQYKLVESLTAKVVSVTPFTVSLTGSWVYVLSQEYEQSLAQAIQEETPSQARTYLLHTGVISQASIPNTLPPAMYINFLVLVGK